MAGVTGAVAPSGQLNPGNLSISGQRESANAFLVNGSDVQERMNGGTSIVPDLDSVDQFRVLTSNFDPQYGNYNGGIVSAITRSGSDVFHGSAFDFVRNTSLDQRNYFSPSSAEFNQQQAGRHGWAVRSKREGVLLRRLSVRDDRRHRDRPSGADAGRTQRNFLIAGTSLTDRERPALADLLSQRLWVWRSPGERITQPGCTSAANCVLPRCHPPRMVVAAQSCLPYPGQFGDGRFRQRVPADRARRQGIISPSTATAGFGCCPPTTSSMTTGWTIRHRRAG